MLSGAVAVAVALLGAACSSNSDPGHPGRGFIAAVGAENEYANVIGADRRAGSLGERDHEQPEHRSAHVRGEPERRPGRERRAARRPERRRLRQLHEQDRGGLAELDPQGDRRPDAARAARQHPEPAPLVQPDDDAGRREGDQRRSLGAAPAHAAYFAANLRRFDASLQPWLQAIARLKARFPNTPVATTEPVADYMLQAAGIDNLTPFTLQADIMNGVDPSPQGVSLAGEPLHASTR